MEISGMSLLAMSPDDYAFQLSQKHHSPVAIGSILGDLIPSLERNQKPS
jgi:hypothetical protein